MYIYILHFDTCHYIKIQRETNRTWFDILVSLGRSHCCPDPRITDKSPLIDSDRRSDKWDYFLCIQSSVCHYLPKLEHVGSLPLLSISQACQYIDEGGLDMEQMQARCLVNPSRNSLDIHAEKYGALKLLSRTMIVSYLWLVM